MWLTGAHSKLNILKQIKYKFCFMQCKSTNLALKIKHFKAKKYKILLHTVQVNDSSEGKIIKNVKVVSKSTF
jgi:hypothetical protein